MIFALDFGAPWWRMNAQPCFAFRLPLSAQMIRNSIGEPKRNEIDCALLLPMWQAVRSEPNVCVRIKEVQFGHRKTTAD